MDKSCFQDYCHSHRYSTNGRFYGDAVSVIYIFIGVCRIRYHALGLAMNSFFTLTGGLLSVVLSQQFGFKYTFLLSLLVYAEAMVASIYRLIPLEEKNGTGLVYGATVIRGES